MPTKTSKHKTKRAIKKKSGSHKRAASKKATSKTAPKAATAKVTPPTTEGNIGGQDVKQKPKKKVGLSLNWNRAIHINRTIDDALVKELTPLVLKMKQESSQPITVGIDSPGGSIAAVQSLLSLLKSPDQDGRSTPIYTVSTNRAYSAAASLLAFGDYSVAFPHSRILYHDVRYSGIDDVTPSKALKTARELERGNVAFALRLAHHIRGRLIWVYLDLMPRFKDVRTHYASFTKDYDEAFKEFLPQKKGKTKTVDIVAFSLALFNKLSSPADKEIAIQALKLVNSWMEIESIERKLSTKKPKGGKSLSLVQGIDELVTEIHGMETEGKTPSKSPAIEAAGGLTESAREDVKLLLEVLARRFATDKDLRISDEGLDMIVEDFSFIRDIRSNQHIHAITKMMIDHGPLFFDRLIMDKIRNAKNSAARRKILDPFYPQARILWYYIVLVCRCLCRGDHLLSPGDAQLLGLVDEVLGGGAVQSRREWRKSSPDYEQSGPS